tara:strand:- start:68 stop:346 length:279 start_codon:yes stop_codon:yes gene_type:complete
MESKVQSKITKFLEKEGWWVCKIMTCSKNGYPDLQAFRDGVPLVCEVKQAGKEPRTLQYFRLKELAAVGVIALWADSIEVFKKKYYEALNIK